MPKKEHIHKYLRVIQNKDTGWTVYKCVLPGCKHWLRSELLIGREAICWKCSTAMVIGPLDIQMKKMRHYECRRGANGGQRAELPTSLVPETEEVDADNDEPDY